MDITPILENQVFSGIAGGSLMMSALYLLRAVPERIGKWLAWQFTARATVHNEDSAFEMVEDWLAVHGSAAAARRLKLASRWSTHADRDDVQAAHGFGNHLVWHRRRPLLIQREENTQQGSYRRRESITLLTIGRSPEPLRRIIQEIVDTRTGAASDHVEVYLYRDYWRLASRKMKRALEMIVLPPAQRQRITEDLDRFCGAREWYQRIGIPYRRGVLLSGPPGCGKTSLAIALAGHLGRRVYALNIGSINGDEQLIDAVSMVPENAVLLIEDIDATQRDRSGGDSDEKQKPITMSGLLNCLDGVFARDGRILIMTTNHPEKIDPALLRPGRADLREEIGLLDRSGAREMCRLFGRMEVSENVETPIAPAELQQRLIAAERGCAVVGGAG